MYRIVEPASDLKPFIESYWVVLPHHEETVQLRVDVYPDARADLLFNYGAPYLRTTYDGTVEYQDSNLDTQRVYPIVIHQHGVVKIVGVRFQVGGLGAFIRTPLSRFTGHTPSIEETLGDDGLILETEIEIALPDLEAVGCLLDSFFIARLDTSHEYQTFQRILGQLITSDGPLVSQTLGFLAGLSKRTVSRYFARYLGLTVNTVQQITRFQKSLQYLMTGPEGNLAQVSSDCGYFDQSHFIRDFKKFARGIPGEFRHYFPERAPRDFAPNLVQFVQDT